MTDPAAESEQFTSCVTVTAFHVVGVETGRSLSNFNKTNQPILTIEGKEQGQVDDCVLDIRPLTCKSYAKSYANKFEPLFVVGHLFLKWTTARMKA